MFGVASIQRKLLRRVAESLQPVQPVGGVSGAEQGGSRGRGRAGAVPGGGERRSQGRAGGLRGWSRRAPEIVRDGRAETVAAPSRGRTKRADRRRDGRGPAWGLPLSGGHPRTVGAPAGRTQCTAYGAAAAVHQPPPPTRAAAAVDHGAPPQRPPNTADSTATADRALRAVPCTSVPRGGVQGAVHLSPRAEGKRQGRIMSPL